MTRNTVKIAVIGFPRPLSHRLIERVGEVSQHSKVSAARNLKVSLNVSLFVWTVATEKLNSAPVNNPPP